MKKEITESRLKYRNPYAHLNADGQYDADFKNIDSGMDIKIFETLESKCRKQLCNQYALINDEGVVDRELLEHLSPFLSEKLSFSNVEIEKISREVLKFIYKNRDKIWDNPPEDLAEMLAPEVTFALIGYDINISSSLGNYGDNGETFEAAGIINNKDKKVYISTEFSKKEQRFTMAHELGHALLHKKELMLHRDRPLDGSKNATDKKEIEANKFAANLLMPRKLLSDTFISRFGNTPFVLNEETASLLALDLDDTLRKVRKNGKHYLAKLLAKHTRVNGREVMSLSELFHVSTAAMAIRLEELDLV